MGRSVEARQRKRPQVVVKEDTEDHVTIQNQTGTFVLERCDTEGRNALFVACMGNDPAKVKKLLADTRFDVNKKDKYGFTPLMAACSANRFKIVGVLLQHKDLALDIKVEIDDDDWSALDVAAKHNAIGCIKAIQQDPRCTALLVAPAINVALQHDSVDSLKQLLLSIDYNYKPSEIIYDAVNYNALGCIKVLLNNSNFDDGFFEEGVTSCLDHKNIEALKLVLTHKDIKINAEDVEAAIEDKELAILALLLEHPTFAWKNMDPDIINICRSNGNHEITRFMLKAGADSLTDLPKVFHARRCYTCGDNTASQGSSRLKLCMKCNKVRYCCTECQKYHWITGHREECV